MVCLYTVFEATASAELSRDFKEAVSFGKLSGESQEIISKIGKNPTFTLQIGPRKLRGNKIVFQYLVDHLELCAIAGRGLQIGKYQTRREEDGRLYGDDGEGATGYLTFLHAEDDKRVLFVEGTQKGLFTVGGHSVAVLHFSESDDEGHALEYDLQVWVRVDSAFFAFFSRLFLEMSKKTADQQFTKMLGIPVGVMGKIERDAAAVLQVFEQLPDDEQAQLHDLKGMIEK